MEVDSTRWEIIKEWKEGRRNYLEVRCNICNTHFDRSRKEQIFGKVLRQCECDKTVRGKPFEIGERIGKLVVLERDNSITDNKHVWWKVKCDCGEIKYLQGSQLRNGTTSTCGCLLSDKRGSKRENHGRTKTKEYKIWTSMCGRVTRPDESTRKWYFDKGISVSSEWRAGFTQFYEDMGDCPEGYSLDRIDPAGDYCKENCRWASLELQSINKGLFCNNTSGKTGVSLNQHGKYMAYIYNKGERIHLGSHITYESAVKARLEAEEKYWGDINE